MKRKHIMKILIVIGAIVILASMAKSLKLYKKDNILEQVIHRGDKQPENSIRNKNDRKTEILNEESIDSKESEENAIEQKISDENGGVPIYSQNDIVSNDYCNYQINKVTISKKLGDFYNPYGILGHVDKDGNTLDGYSYYIVNMTIECDKKPTKFFLNTMSLRLYQGSNMVGGHELLTTNYETDMEDPNCMQCTFKENEKKTMNLVFLIEDNYIESTNQYISINNTGASANTDVENKRLIRIEEKEKKDE